MRNTLAACLSLLIVTFLMIAGCTSPNQETGPEPPCPGQEPIVGTWFYDQVESTGIPTDEITLLMVKETGRFDAAAVPRDRAKPLPYEIWISGAWEKTGPDRYTLTGQYIRHDFANDSHTAFDFHDTMAYAPGKDMLVTTSEPYGIFTRESCEPKVPPGLDVSIPWD